MFQIPKVRGRQYALYRKVYSPTDCMGTSVIWDFYIIGNARNGNTQIICRWNRLPMFQQHLSEVEARSERKEVTKWVKCSMTCSIFSEGIAVWSFYRKTQRGRWRPREPQFLAMVTSTMLQTWALALQVMRKVKWYRSWFYVMAPTGVISVPPVNISFCEISSS